MTRPTSRGTLCDPVLEAVGVRHGFGSRGSILPEAAWRPRQVHGAKVWQVPPDDPASAVAPEADAVIGRGSRTCVGIVTADCVPLLAALEDGSAVVAIHAGWRGLTAGVIEAGLAALAALGTGRRIVAAIGPAARGCCYEVDEPVRAAVARRYGEALGAEVLRPVKRDHYLLDLALLASWIVVAWGVDSASLGTSHRLCTICDPERFESHRRDGSAAGRLGHFVETR